MRHEHYISVASEIQELESLLAEIPEENVIDRLGLESRLEEARSLIASVPEEVIVNKARLTFRGPPVVGSHGIVADFAAVAAGSFAKAVTAVAASISDNLRDKGPIPNRQENQLLITGTAIGSFGFEFELPNPDNNEIFPVRSKAEDALQKIKELFRLAANGTDDEVAELIDEIHPRAVKNAAEFLEYLAENGAWCGVEFKDEYFRFSNIDQLRFSADRLKEDNIDERDESYRGEFQGVLPKGRAFEFKKSGDKNIIKGKVGVKIDDADVLNRKFLHQAVNAEFHVIQFGKGQPRYTLESLDNISA